MQDFRRNCMGEFDFLTPTNLETTMNLDSLEFLYGTEICWTIDIINPVYVTEMQGNL